MARRLLLLINSLEGGGAEKVMATLAGAFRQRHPEVDITLALLDDIRPDVHRPPDGIGLIRLDARQSFWRSILAVHRLIRSTQPDMVLAFLTRSNCAAVLGRGRGGPRCVISERVHTTSHLGTGLRGRVLRAVVRAVYRHADAVVPVSRGVGAELTRAYRVPADRVVAPIPNPVDIAGLRRSAAQPPAIDLPEDFFVAVGRLMPNKAFDRMLHAFAAHKATGRALVLLGEGPQRQALGALAQSLGIGDRVMMPGYVSNPHAIVARATAYVSASRSEGFPNALVEAMALGRAVIATDCPSGPAEIIAGRPEGRTATLDGEGSGLLVPVDDVDALREAMDRIDAPALRRDYEQRAADRVQHYGSDAVFAQYEAVLGL